MDTRISADAAETFGDAGKTVVGRIATGQAQRPTKTTETARGRSRRLKDKRERKESDRESERETMRSEIEEISQHHQIHVIQSL